MTVFLVRENAKWTPLWVHVIVDIDVEWSYSVIDESQILFLACCGSLRAKHR